MIECPQCQSFNERGALACVDCGAALFDDPRMIAPAPPKAARPTRLSVSKADRNTEIGVELLSLLQAVTEDGSVSVDGVSELAIWLSANRHVDMPAIGFLSQIVAQIIADGVVTDEERVALYSAIEKVLPADLRRFAVSNRKGVEAKSKILAKERQLKNRQRSSPVLYFSVMAAGVAYDGRAVRIEKFARDGMPVYLIREKSNHNRNNAIAIYVRPGGMIGYIPKSEAREIANLLDRGFKCRAEIDKIVTRTRSGYPILIVDGEVFSPEASAPGALSQADMPAIETERQPAAGQGCMTCAVIAFGVFVFVFLIAKC